MYRVAVALALCCATHAAHAGPSRLNDGYGGDPTEPLGFAFDHITPRVERETGLRMEFNLRVRAMTVPRSVLDIWYLDDNDPNWAYIEPRPRITGTALGLEYSVLSGSNQGIFYAEYVDSSMKPGYWDDIDSPQDYLDGDFVATSKGFGLVGFGANYMFNAPIIRPADTRNAIGLSYIVGGGLGLGVLVGRMDVWGPDDIGNPAYKRFLDGAAPDEDRNLPRVLPLVDISSGLRVSVGERFVMRFEGGLHSTLFYGCTAGVVF